MLGIIVFLTYFVKLFIVNIYKYIFISKYNGNMFIGQQYIQLKYNGGAFNLDMLTFSGLIFEASTKEASTNHTT